MAVSCTCHALWRVSDVSATSASGLRGKRLTNRNSLLSVVIAIIYTVAPRYNAPRYYADSDITRSVVDPEFLPPGENVKWYLEML